MLSLISLILRIGNPEAAVLPTALILSSIVVGILLVAGWLGGELAYRFEIGVIEETTRPLSPAIAPADTGRRPRKT